MKTNPSSQEKISPQKYTDIILMLFIFLLVIFLGIMILNGTFIRYMADDYCYGAEVNQGGFWKTQINSYLNQMPFNSNRYSLTFTHSLVEIFGGPYFAPWVPGLSIVAWVTGLFYAGVQFSKIFKSSIDKKIILIGSLLIVFFSLYLAPNQFQIFYWLSGSFTYLLPLIITSSFIGVLLNFYHNEKTNIKYLLCIGLFAFFAGGYSETTALWQFTALSLLTIIFLILRISNNHFKKLIISAFIGLSIAIILLVISPPNLLDMQASNFKQPDLITLILRSIGNSRMFISRSIKYMPIPFFVIGSLGLGLGWISRNNEKSKPESILIQLFSIMAGSYLMILSTIVPSMLAMSAYPGDRSLIPAMFTLVCCIFLVAWKFARYVSVSYLFKRIQNQLGWIFLVFSLSIFIFSTNVIPEITKNTVAYRERAKDWDFRHDLLIQAEKDNLDMVKVPAFESIAEILELDQNPDFWTNNCAETYYRVESIEAHTKYLDIPTHPIIP